MAVEGGGVICKTTTKKEQKKVDVHAQTTIIPIYKHQNYGPTLPPLAFASKSATTPALYPYQQLLAAPLTTAARTAIYWTVTVVRPRPNFRTLPNP